MPHSPRQVACFAKPGCRRIPATKAELRPPQIGQRTVGSYLIVDLLCKSQALVIQAQRLRIRRLVQGDPAQIKEHPCDAAILLRRLIQFALEQLAHAPDDAAATRARHAGFYLETLRDYAPELRSSAQQSVLRKLADEIDNVRTAWAWAVEQRRFDALLVGLQSFGWMFELRGWLREGVEQLEMAIQAARADRQSPEQCAVLGVALAQQGLLIFRTGAFSRALQQLHESIAILRLVGERALLAAPLIYAGIITHLNGELEPARAYFAEGLLYAQAGDDEWLAVYASFNLGYLDSLNGRYEEGFKRMAADIERWRAIGDPYAVALGLNYISPTLIGLGRCAEALASLEESLAICRQNGDRWGVGTAYRFLGLVMLKCGDAQAAQALLRTSLDCFAGFVTGWDIVRSLIYLGEAVAAAGDTGEARRILRDALRQGHEIGSIPLLLEALVVLAELDLQAGAEADALRAAAFVARHPQSIYEARARAAQICAAAESRLSAGWPQA
jgi:tetratricopeptide (TPR) repeat protein